MRAVVFEKYGPPSVLKLASVPRPSLLPRDVLVQVKAVSVNPTDCKQRTNWMRAPGDGPEQPYVTGRDGAGLVVALGIEAKMWKVGDEVFFAGVITRAGCYAEYVAIDERIIAAKPQSLSFEQSAAEPLTMLTAFESMYECMGIQETEDNNRKAILITAGAGGVGSAAVQIAKKLLRLRVIATASRAETVAYCREMGADDVIDHSKPLAPQLKELGFADGVHYVFHCADATAKAIDELVQCVLPFGHLNVIAPLADPQPVNFLALCWKRVTLSAEIMYARGVFNVEPERQHAILTRLAQLLDNGTFKSRMLRCYSLFANDDIVRAHVEQESGRLAGKTSLRVE